MLILGLGLVACSRSQTTVAEVEPALKCAEGAAERVLADSAGG